MIEQEAGFTDQQLADFQQLRQHHHSQMIAYRNEITELRLQIIDQVFSPVPDHQAIERMTAQIGALHTEAERLTADHIHNVLEMSNPEQRTRLRELFRSMMNDLRRPHPRMGPGRGRGFGPGMGRGQGRGRNWQAP
jgi:Spy/CpxP family protein refolding chaperone